MDALTRAAQSTAHLASETAHDDPILFCMLAFGTLCVIWVMLYMIKNHRTGFRRLHF